MAELLYSLTDAVATITLNRPERKNAFSPRMIEDLAEALGDASADDTVGAIVLTGAGDAFCSGVDLDSIGDLGADPLKWKSFLHNKVQTVPRTAATIDKPLIAAVTGPAVGAGMDFALMCDMRFASESASFCESYIRIGMVPGAGGCWFLPRIVGMPKATELFLSGDFVDAQEALRIGLVNRVLPSADTLVHTQEFAAKLAAGPPLATRMLKRMLVQSARTDLDTALDLASSHMGVARSTSDAAEALSAFRERRPASYKGD